MSLLDLDVIRRARLEPDPYPFIAGSGLVSADVKRAVQMSFPDIRITGFHPADEVDAGGAFHELIGELEDQPLSEALSDTFGIDFCRYPRLTTVRRISAAHEGRIHCDSAKKVASLLLYMNDSWSSPDGRLRVLRSKNFHDCAREIDPVTGSMFAFLRSDNSWHGHTPFAGERRVIQVAWLRSQHDVAHKTRHHRFAGLLKGIFSHPGHA